MRVLIVCSGNVDNFNFKVHQSFIYEQIETLKKNFDINYNTFFIRGRGIKGYLKNLKKLKFKIKEYQPDLIHAHYGLSGMLSVIQFKIPVVVTFHGSDCNKFFNRLISNIVHLLSSYSIFVTQKLFKKLILKKNRKSSFIKCGINIDDFKPFNKDELKVKNISNSNKVNVLFSSSFNNKVKNYELAKSALSILSIKVNLIELKNKSREEVNLLLNTVDFLLLTSLSEGSPQIIKEAMVCNCPIVATDVGDIRELIGDTEGCYITTFDPQNVAEKINLAIDFAKNKGRTNGREKILNLDNKIIAEKIYKIYKKVLKIENSNN